MLIEMNMAHIDSWKFKSNHGKQVALGLASIGMGVALMVAFRHFDASGMTNSLAGFLLGVFLLLLGSTTLLIQGRQTVVVDLQTHQIVVEDTTPFGIKKRIIPFHDILDTGLGYLGKKSNFVIFYYINLHLKNGKVYSLFPPGRFYDGSSDRSVMETRRRQLEELLTQHPSR